MPVLYRESVDRYEAAQKKDGRDGKRLSTLSAEFLSMIYGLASAVSWGAGDFSGGFATRRAAVYSVIVVSQLVGGILLLILALAFAEAMPPASDLLVGGFAGVCGTFGLVAMYSGLAKGRMGVVAPVAAMVTAVLPVTVGIFSEGVPPRQQIAGFGLALVAVWFLARDGSNASVRLKELALPVAAGIGFGFFFILIDLTTSTAVVWPLISARIVSLTTLSVFAIVRRYDLVPARDQFPVIAMAGIFDTGGNAFFALATHLGRLDIATMLSSLYPAATVLLAWFILKERLVRRQWVGVGAALCALVLIAV